MNDNQKDIHTYNLEDFISLKKKPSLKIAGLMSGTSLDGVDAVLVEVKGSGRDTEIKELGFITYPFPQGVKEEILRNSLINSGNVTNICKLNFLIAYIYADAIKALCKSLNIEQNQIDLIGSHGQTIQHLPDKENFYGYNFKSTLQIGDPSVLAKLTGIPVIGDFRVGDAALDGEAAPLVPYFDYLMLSSPEKNRCLLNIGGIANLTVIPASASKDEVLAFDIGPGNLLIDSAVKELYNIDYDKDGKIASSGKIDAELIKRMAAEDQFIERKPPKSTGREYYNLSFVKEFLDDYNGPEENFIATVTFYTVYSFITNYEKFIKDSVLINELYISGGGAKNNFIMECFRKYFNTTADVHTIEELGFSSDSKEAVCFAVLANEALHGNAQNMPGITHSIKETILGKICLP